MQEAIYLDHAAATPVCGRAIAAMQPFWQQDFYNPSSAYMAARSVRNEITKARESIAIAIGAKRDEIVFTAGATKSSAIAIHGVMAGDESAKIIIAATEHSAVKESAKTFQATILPVDSVGRILLSELEKMIDDSVRLIAVAHADSEIGTIQPIREVSLLIEKIRQDRYQRGVSRPIYLYCDASQSFPTIDTHVARLGADLLTLNGAKCYGPKQSAVLWVRAGVVLKPLIVGGGQERGLRSGTESPALIAGLAAAIVRANEKRSAESKRLAEMRDQLQARLVQSEIADIITINGSPKHRLAGHLHVSFAGCDAERLLFSLDEMGILVSTGAACGANKQTRSHVLEAIGMQDSMADSSLRFSFGKLNNIDQLDRIYHSIVETVIREKGK